MKKNVLLLPAFLFVSQFVKAQKPDAAVALVHYSFSHIRDTTHKKKVYTENMELLLGKNASVYRSSDSRLIIEQMKKRIAGNANTGTTGTVNMTGAGGSHGSLTEFFQFQAEKKLIRQEKIINIYLIEEPEPVIDWKITADTASFGSLHCQKATTTFKGRDYIAWFCPALPFRSGPWKLNGLPGLIVEAFDSKKEVAFKFAGLEDVSIIAEKSAPVVETDLGTLSKFSSYGEEKYSLKTIELPENGLKTTEKEYIRLKEAKEKDPMGFINSALAGSGADARITSMTRSTTAVKNVINNPIELTGKP